MKKKTTLTISHARHVAALEEDIRKRAARETTLAARVAELEPLLVAETEAAGDARLERDEARELGAKLGRALDTSSTKLDATERELGVFRAVVVVALRELGMQFDHEPDATAVRDGLDKLVPLIRSVVEASARERYELDNYGRRLTATAAERDAMMKLVADLRQNSEQNSRVHAAVSRDLEQAANDVTTLRARLDATKRDLEQALDRKAVVETKLANAETLLARQRAELEPTTKDRDELRERTARALNDLERERATTERLRQRTNDLERSSLDSNARLRHALAAIHDLAKAADAVPRDPMT